MTKQQKQYLRDVIESDSFEYAFVHYSHFSEINDPEFHRLREAYLAAMWKLSDHIGVKP